MSEPIKELIAELRERGASNFVDPPTRDKLTRAANALSDLQARVAELQEVEAALSRRCYLMSEPHLSGYRLVIGFNTPGEVMDAHEAIALLKAPTHG